MNPTDQTCVPYRATTFGTTCKVTIDGQSVTGGSIRCHPTAADTKSKPSGGVIGADGSYSVPDAPVGACKVTVDTGLAKGAATKNEPKGEPKGLGADIMKKMQGPPAGDGRGPRLCQWHQACPDRACLHVGLLDAAVRGGEARGEHVQFRGHVTFEMT
jgi:hypothetical protein